MAPFDKSLFYQNLFCTLGKKSSLPTTGLSLTNDPRNFSAKWLVLKSPLTPLASTEKKTISGFDTRLAGLKGPAKIKASRRAGALLYSEVFTSRLPLLGGTNPIAPFISQGRGWGVRSSRANSYLRGSPFLGLKKLPCLSFFAVSLLPKSILIQHGQALLTEGGSGVDTLPDGAAFLVSSDVNLGKPLLMGGTFFEGKVENPNITPKNQAPQAEPTVLARD